MPHSHMVTNISPIDGRYLRYTKDLQQYCSEFGLIKYRIEVEINWLIFLAKCPDIKELKQFNTEEERFLRSIYECFNIEDAKTIKEIERTTNHDVKAVEYFIKNKLESYSPNLKSYSEFVHFACTSEDINNIAYALMVNKTLDNIIKPQLSIILSVLDQKIVENSESAMMSLTHGQPATPTTMGKELRNQKERLLRQLNILNKHYCIAKINGAVGNFNAHVVAYPNIDWIQLSKNFINSLGLEANLYTTQIESHDTIAEVFHCLVRMNQILIDLSQDIWGYISLGYFVQQNKSGEIGSSTMPHKVNPICFENAEGNLGIANALMDHMAKKLEVSRFQRDLTDSTVLRNIGSVFAYSLIAYKSLEDGFSRISGNKNKMLEVLADKWELLAEPIQTVMRKYNVDGAYEILKNLSRGKKVTKASIDDLVNSLNIPQFEKDILLQLTPEKYIGLAVKLAKM